MRLALVLIALLSSTAEAGRRRFGWSYDTETVPERGVELETWVTEETGPGASAALRWMTVFGLTDRLELAIPVDVVWRDLPAPMSDRTAFEAWGLEARWRLASADPVESGPFVSLVRLGVFRRVLERRTAELEGNAVFSYALPACLYAVLDLGGRLNLTEDEDAVVEGLAGAGLAGQLLVEDLRLGAELFLEHRREGDLERTWLAAGPVLSYTHGRLWLVASLPLGLTSDAPDLLPRLLWGIAF